ncbi:unnamed protein product [Hermetia illucens]|uniref:Condensin-2 complex subunit H2 C-terminal domain-containing protein n=1 Tax=Hermetia illucens TaxID=343691 RepID=A0A7R8V4W9_HERIL|nr:uncharacterized protein LOC119659963 isoform X2 [Hermetia illucens]CAD7092926.1 unnamed protein product [Hermetia illucens]
MGANKGGKLNRLHRKKKKKNKKSKRQKTDAHEDNRIASLMLNSQNTSARIQDLIKDTLANVTREKIIQLLFQVRSRADYCYDFDFSWWLQKFLELGDDVNLIEAAYLIVNAGHIYEKKVDFFYELVRRSAERNENESEATDKKQQTPKTRRKITRQAVTVHDRLYESEMLIKQFKQMPPERITEVLSTSSFKAPSTYFKKWAEYKQWRINHKKKMKSALPYSTVCDDMYLHPAMWGLSCIEDFDYDDDLDTKRNYRMFTHFMEHRFNTLVPDINFIMHFKVKDFIEAEEDEIAIMKILDLPTPPSREWPPFCRTPYSKEYAKETFNVDIGESAEDYLKKYVDLEDIVLEKQTYEIDSDLIRSATEAQKNNKNVQSSVCQTTTSGQAPLPEIENLPLANNVNVNVDLVADGQLVELELGINDFEDAVDVGNVNNALESSKVAEGLNSVHTSIAVQLTGSTEGAVNNGPAEIGTDVAPVNKESAEIETGIGPVNKDPAEIETGVAPVNKESPEIGAGVNNELRSSEGDIANTNAVNVASADATPTTAVVSGETAEVLTSSADPQAPTQENGAPIGKETNRSGLENADIIEMLAENLAKALNSNTPLNIKNSLENGQQPLESSAEPALIESIEILAPLNEELMNGERNPQTAIDEIPISIDITTIEDQREGVRVGSRDAPSIISENIKSNISDQIVIRISIDEGIAFGDLDDVDKAMLSPVVELVDIFNPIKEEVLSCEDLNFTVEKGFRNILEIDERFLDLQENFQLPLDFIHKNPEIRYNFLKLPETRLKRKINFALPAEFDLYMSSRIKRRCHDRSDAPPRVIRVFKLNEQNIKNIPMTPPATPNPDDDFLGFDEDNEAFRSITCDDILSSTLNTSTTLPPTPNRTISRDSGIGLTSLSDSQITNMSTIEESDGAITIEISTEDSGISTSTGPETSVNQDISIALDGSEIVKVIPASNGIDGMICEGDTVERDNVTINLENGSSNQIDETIERNEAGPSTKRVTIEESAEFEQNLYEKCNNRIMEKRASEMNLMMERIQKWHRYLRPILAVSMERHHFDIFAIGTDIIDTFPKEDVVKETPPVTTLEDVMADRDPTFLSRYFLSMLQLANANNVEINVKSRDSNKPTALRDVNLKLLSRKRHSVAIEDDIGASVHSSRKRQHPLTDESDSDSGEGSSSPVKYTLSLDHRQNSTTPYSKQPAPNAAPRIPMNRVVNKVQETPNGRDIRGYGSSQPRVAPTPPDKAIASGSRTSTPCATATNPSHLQKAMTTDINQDARAKLLQSSLVRASLSPIPSCSRGASSSNRVHTDLRQDKVSSSKIIYKRDFPSVSNALLSIYKSRKQAFKDCSSDNFSTPSKNQEILSKANASSDHTNLRGSSSKELPPFELIRRHDEVAEKCIKKYIEAEVSPNSTYFVENMNQSNIKSQESTSSSTPAYPRLIRTQETISFPKRSRLGNDDLDSGIFSEFSMSENVQS